LKKNGLHPSSPKALLALSLQYRVDLVEAYEIQGADALQVQFPTQTVLWRDIRPIGGPELADPGF
jgi:hypothetical protein